MPQIGTRQASSKTVFEKSNMYEGSKIITGDFNTVLDVSLDKTSTNKNISNNFAATNTILEFIEEYNLEDIWRVRNPNKKQYTWSRQKPRFVGSRLDYFLTDIGMTSWVTNVEIGIGYKSDHRSIALEINPYAVF